jgi:hypothetical protein
VSANQLSSGSYVYSSSNDNLILGSSQNWSNRIAICLNGSTPTITFESDGTVTFHEAYTLSEVAKVVWESFAACNPMHGEVARLKREIQDLERQLSQSRFRASDVG